MPEIQTKIVKGTGIQPIVAYQGSGNILNEKTLLLNIETDIQLIHDLAQELIDTVEFLGEGCLGLAAPQIKRQDRMCAIREESGDISILINPTYEAASLETPWVMSTEICFSLPDVTVEVMRRSDITVRYIDFPSLEYRTMEVGNPRSVVYQHEIDHLDGILIVDSMDTFRKGFIQNKLKRVSRGNVPTYYPMQIKNKVGHYEAKGSSRAIQSFVLQKQLGMMRNMKLEEPV